MYPWNCMYRDRWMYNHFFFGFNLNLNEVGLPYRHHFVIYLFFLYTWFSCEWISQGTVPVSINCNILISFWLILYTVHTVLGARRVRLLLLPVTRRTRIISGLVGVVIVVVVVVVVHKCYCRVVEGYDRLRLLLVQRIGTGRVSTLTIANAKLGSRTFFFQFRFLSTGQNWQN